MTRTRLIRSFLGIVAVLALVIAPAAATTPNAVYRIDHVVDGDTVDLASGAKVRLVQIDTPGLGSQATAFGRSGGGATPRSAFSRDEAERAQ